MVSNNNVALLLLVFHESQSSSWTLFQFRKFFVLIMNPRNADFFLFPRDLISHFVFRKSRQIHRIIIILRSFEWDLMLNFYSLSTASNMQRDVYWPFQCSLLIWLVVEGFFFIFIVSFGNEVILNFPSLIDMLSLVICVNIKSVSVH